MASEHKDWAVLCGLRDVAKSNGDHAAHSRLFTEMCKSIAADKTTAVAAERARVVAEIVAMVQAMAADESEHDDAAADAFRSLVVILKTKYDTAVTSTTEPA